MRQLISKTYDRSGWDCSQHGGDGSYYLRCYGYFGFCDQWLTYSRWFAANWYPI